MSLSNEAGQLFDARLTNTVRIMSATANTTVGVTVNAAVTLSFATIAGYHLSPGIIHASYSASGAGHVYVKDYAGNTYHQLDITASGAAPFDLDKLLLPVSTGMVVSMPAVASSTGTLNVYPHQTKA